MAPRISATASIGVTERYDSRFSGSILLAVFRRAVRVAFADCAAFFSGFADWAALFAVALTRADFLNAFFFLVAAFAMSKRSFICAMSRYFNAPIACCAPGFFRVTSYT